MACLRTHRNDATATNGQPGLILVLIGLFLAAAGLFWLILPNIPWLGRLPGDIRWKGKQGGFYFPIVTCLLLSLLLSALLWLVRHF